MNRDYQSADRVFQKQNKEAFKLVINQAKQINDEQEYHQSRLETKNTSMFSFQDQSAMNKSSNENSNHEKIALFSPPLSQKEGQQFFQQSFKSKNHFQLKLKPLVVPIISRKNSQESLQQSLNQISSPEKQQLNQQKQNSLIMQELQHQQTLSIQKLQSIYNEGNDEAQSPSKNKLQLFIDKQVIDFNSEEEINWIIRIAKKTHKTKMELAYFRKFVFQFDPLEQCLKNLEKENISQEIFNQFKLMIYNPNRIISNTGETFYIVLRGSLVCKDKLNEPFQNIGENDIKINSLVEDIEDQGYQIQEFESSNTETDENQDNYTIVKRYLPGDSFGDIRLDNNSYSRKQVIVTESECCIIQITKEQIQSILAKHKASELQEQIDFFKSFSFFYEIPDYFIIKLIKSSQVRSFIRGDIVFQESDQVENIFFIKNGEVEISKLIDFDPNQDQTTTNINQKIIIPVNTSQNITQNQSPLIKKKNKEISPLKFSQNQKKRIQIKILTQNSYFGQEEILQKLTKRESKAKVLSQSAQIFAINQLVKNNGIQSFQFLYFQTKQNFMALLQKYCQLQKLIDENSLKEIAESERKKLIKKVQVKIKQNDMYDQSLKFSQICKTSGNSPRSSRDLKSPIMIRHKSNIFVEKQQGRQGINQQFSSLIFDNSSNKAILNNCNSNSNIYIPLQSQNTLEDIEIYSLTQRHKIKTLPNSNKNSPRIIKMDSYLVSPNKRQISSTRFKQEFFSDLCEDSQQYTLTDRKNIQNSHQQQIQPSSEYSLSPIQRKQVSKSNLTPQVFKINSSQQDVPDNFNSASQRILNQNNYKSSKSITNFKAFDYSCQKQGNIFDQNGNPILLVQFNTDLESQTQAQNLKQNKDQNQLQTQNNVQSKKINLKAIFKQPFVKGKNTDRAKSQAQIDESLERNQTIRNNDFQDKNQKIFYDLSPLKKEILTSLIQKNKQNKLDSDNHYNKSISPLKQLPTHPEILSNIPKKFWKESQKIMEQNEMMVKNGSNVNKRMYQRAGRKSDLPTKSYVDRNMQQIMQIARSQMHISPRFTNQTEEFCQLNIGQINVQNLEKQIKCTQQQQPHK